MVNTLEKLCCQCHQNPRAKSQAYCLECHRIRIIGQKRILKKWAVDKLGRKCMNPTCGLISEHVSAYDFHHLNGESWTHVENHRDMSNLREKELRKWKRNDRIPENIQLLCAVCHRIIHESPD